MKGKRYKLNIDRLEVCYTAPREVIDSLEDTTFWEREGYRLQEFSRDRLETIFKIEIITPGKEKAWEVFAWLRIGNRFEKKEDTFRYCWIALDNRALYTPGKDYGELAYLYWVEEDLGLSFNNISYLEIALDSNVNWFRRVRAALRTEELTPVVLGKAYQNMKDRIKKLLYIHTGDRLRYRTDTLSLKSANGEIALEIYNKGEEIEESEKNYIRECFGLASGGLYRLEVKVRNRAFEDFCSSRGLTQYDIYNRLLDSGILFDIWLFYCNKLLRFKEKRTQVSLVQL